MNITKVIKRREYDFEVHTEKFLWHHPVLGFFFAFIGMPVLVLCAVCAITIVFAFPMALLFGWL